MSDDRNRAYAQEYPELDLEENLGDCPVESNVEEMFNQEESPQELEPWSAELEPISQDIY